MKFRIKKTSDSFSEPDKFIEVSSLQELKIISEKENCPLIISFWDDPEIEIYNIKHRQPWRKKKEGKIECTDQ